VTPNRSERRTPVQAGSLHDRGGPALILQTRALTGSRQNLLKAVAKDKEKQKRSKKDAQLVLRLNKDLRNRFVDACQDLDTSAAREVRRFIKRFLRRYDKGELDD
jgi:undecaprenyl pyrophosphate synthase